MDLSRRGQGAGKRVVSLPSLVLVIEPAEFEPAGMTIAARVVRSSGTRVRVPARIYELEPDCRSRAILPSTSPKPHEVPSRVRRSYER
jgi:hypothetical protein